MPTRYYPPCSPTHQCTDDEIAGIINELKEISDDSTIIRYERPNIEEMRHIIKTAKAYNGPWYHSSVVLAEDEIISEEHSQLRKEIIALGQDSGISLSYYMSTTPEQEAALEAVFAKGPSN